MIKTKNLGEIKKKRGIIKITHIIIQTTRNKTENKSQQEIKKSKQQNEEIKQKQHNKTKPETKHKNIKKDTQTIKYNKNNKQNQK